MSRVQFEFGVHNYCGLGDFSPIQRHEMQVLIKYNAIYIW